MYYYQVAVLQSNRDSCSQKIFISTIWWPTSRKQISTMQVSPLGCPANTLPRDSTAQNTSHLSYQRSVNAQSSTTLNCNTIMLSVWCRGLLGNQCGGIWRRDLRCVDQVCSFLWITRFVDSIGLVCHTDTAKVLHWATATVIDSTVARAVSLRVSEPTAKATSQQLSLEWLPVERWLKSRHLNVQKDVTALFLVQTNWTNTTITVCVCSSPPPHTPPITTAVCSFDHSSDGGSTEIDQEWPIMWRGSCQISIDGTTTGKMISLLSRWIV